MKKTGCLLLVVIQLLLLAACAGPAEQPGADTTAPLPAETTAEAVTEAVTEPPTAFEQVELKDLGGRTFSICYIQTDNCYEDFEANELNGSVKNDAVYARNEKVCRALNIEMNVRHDAVANVQEVLKTQVASGGQDYDMYSNSRTGLPLAYGGYLYNLASVESLNLDRIYWDQDFNNSMNINGSLYALVGDISIACQLLAQGITFNKQLFTDLKLDFPYAAVTDGKWTYDKLLELCSGYGADLNGDGQMTYDQDQYGMTGWLTESGYGMFYGSGITFVSKNGDGEFTVSYDADRLSTAIEKVVTLWADKNTYYNNSGSASQHSFPFSVFSSGRALFCDIALSKIGTFLVEMTDDYGIVPEPKLDEDQERYYSYMGYSIPIEFLAANCAEPETVGLILEAFCAASCDDVMPQMLEIVTKSKNVRDYDSAEMINIILRSKIFDPAHWYDLPGLGSLSRTMIVGGNKNVASVIKVHEKTASKQWDTILAEFEKLKNK